MRLRILGLTIALGFIVACGPKDSDPVVGSGSAQTDQVAAIDALRHAIETQTLQRTEIPTQGLRAKIAQKWSKLHVYSDGEQVLRIKSYPHPGISKRTEEFYFDEGRLVLAVIEDDGTDEGGAGDADEDIDKMYYFRAGQVIAERHADDEREYGSPEADGAELLQEAREYLEIYTELQRSLP